MDEGIFVVTNRQPTRDSATGTYRLKDELNHKGARELRLFLARAGRSGQNHDWTLEPIPNRPGRVDFRDLDTRFIPAGRPRVGSDLVAARLVERLRRNTRNLVLFIHGYNNTVENALARARSISRLYGVEVLVFSWPANGGGDRFLEDAHGTLSYLSDKSDARSSTEALDRVLARMQTILTDLNRGMFDRAREEAQRVCPGDREEQHRRMARVLRRQSCPFRVTLLAHSMGNYLYKKALMSSSERLSRDTVFDNVILKAADTNHLDHRLWVERINVRRRVYILINQRDHALGLSTLKLGEAQQARLGCTLARQDAANATYLDLTGYLGDEHSYFGAEDLAGESRALKSFMQTALNGELAHRDLPYAADTNTYRLPDDVRP